MILSRISGFSLAALLLAATAVGPIAHAEDAHEHSISLIGTPKYPADFKHFDYVNPDAPKGGRVRMAAVGGFDSLNPVLYKGDSAAGLGLIYESLTASSLDEDSAAYGQIAEWISHPDDYSSVTFKLREGAKWHDGKPITVEDVIYSLEINKKANPQLGLYYKNVKSAEKTGDREVTFTFDTKDNRELPFIIGQLTILPKHWWTGKDAKGNQRDPLKTTMEPPLGSGPYKIKKVVPGRSITYERVEDYWGKDLPINTGQYNYDTIRFDYYRDPTVAFEAFKAGSLDYHNESSSKNWATAYDFEAVEKGWVKRQEVPVANAAPMQSFAFNIRRPKFQDVRVRRAFALAFDFEWSNKNLFFGQYKRVGSYFENTELAAPKKLPEGRELEILNEVKDEVPPEVFTEVHENPTTEGKGGLRANLREAMKLLNEAGWKVKNGALTNEKTGEKMQVEFLLVNPLFERVVQPYMRNLEKLGIKSSERLVDSAQYTRRLQRFNYDIIVTSFAQSRSPGNEQRYYWGSEAADREGSENLIGIKDPAIDKLIDKVIYAKDREELVAATHALDRVLLWNDFVVPHWYSPVVRIAYWNRYGQPKTLPELSPGFVQVWWYDKEKAAKLPGGAK
ncbi:Oligopeptide-binding protein AppA precursor [Methyloligella halotolerans]|uniref:Oligopeptide-binding protein AppA n=1 Tax=Methyloligella halotolerans TaxID=1177755 RepID=A0A1E2RVX6_9HYPH|nr:extracellular solute-binding protein [Methyloligella halotolerans]ODA66406.1 Oligopeptide-binding protein AppA precursor [Methyloligella halotolerans]